MNETLQGDRRALLYSLLGDLPERSNTLSCRKVKELAVENYMVEVIWINEVIPAYFARSRNVSGKMPVVMFNHSHGGNYHIGKTELLHSSTYLQSESYAKALTDLGYGVLCMDMIGFGERKGKTESELFKEMIWKGEVLWGRMVYDSLRGLDYLVEREDVDSSRIATLGMSMGGLMSWWLAALDTRIRICIDIAAQVEANTLIACRGLDHHGFYSYVPGLLKYFQTSEIQSLIAPRHHLSLVGTDDKLTPLAGLDIIDDELKSVYDKAGFSEYWKMIRYMCGHIETSGMREDVLMFLKNHL
ncbi:prolyl oligopeptidase family serine peptidase [Pradoshia sp. D12]|uniref:dienelactone hydrolase family protein n=1 Tax=Bacillaceae TaxID=186817 RepID=UPI00112D97C5|nr:MULTISPECIES: alpha/beta fold hydrolase [Bacillaceae]QFK71227.1 prolyl oligopeptidase family serine peptidase [Pradoshia sp. D12]TPF73020.1 alpha/beta hydrolase [Bacillus sp. D12]